MTAATVEGTPSLVDVLALETPTAIAAAAYLETVADVGYRRQLAGQLAAQRRQELGLYRALLLERFGTAPTILAVEGTDEVLTELLVLAVA